MIGSFPLDSHDVLEGFIAGAKRIFSKDMAKIVERTVLPPNLCAKNTYLWLAVRGTEASLLLSWQTLARIDIFYRKDFF